jgi:hypothetical protein
MVGLSYTYNENDPACITNTNSTTDSTHYLIRIGYYETIKKQQYKQQKKQPTKEELKMMRSKRLHRSSFQKKDQMTTNIYKTRGFPFKKNKPKAFYL